MSSSPTRNFFAHTETIDSNQKDASKICFCNKYFKNKKRPVFKVFFDFCNNQWTKFVSNCSFSLLPSYKYLWSSNSYFQYFSCYLKKKLFFRIFNCLLRKTPSPKISSSALPSATSNLQLSFTRNVSKFLFRLAIKNVKNNKTTKTYCWNITYLISLGWAYNTYDGSNIFELEFHSLVFRPAWFGIYF